jgi:hypothetical protein
VDQTEPRKKAALPRAMSPKGSSEHSYVDSPGDRKNSGLLGVNTFRITAVAVCRCKGKDTLLSTYYSEFSNKDRSISAIDTTNREHYNRGMKEWQERLGGAVPK